MSQVDPDEYPPGTPFTTRYRVLGWVAAAFVVLGAGLMVARAWGWIGD